MGCGKSKPANVATANTVVIKKNKDAEEKVETIGTILSRSASGQVEKKAAVEANGTVAVEAVKEAVEGEKATEAVPETASVKTEDKVQTVTVASPEPVIAEAVEAEKSVEAVPEVAPTKTDEQKVVAEAVLEADNAASELQEIVNEEKPAEEAQNEIVVPVSEESKTVTENAQPEVAETVAAEDAQADVAEAAATENVKPEAVTEAAAPTAESK